MNDEGVVGIVWWNGKDGTRHYGCRGSGEKYKKFYVWVKQTSYRCISVDWPWDYFVFDNPTDHDRLLENFTDDVWEDK